MSPVADHQTRSTILATGDQTIQFFQQSQWIDDNAGRDHGFDVALKNPGRQQAQLIGLAVKLDGMTSIVASLIPHNDVMTFCQDVDDLALGFVAPLQTNH